MNEFENKELADKELQTENQETEQIEQTEFDDSEQIIDTDEAKGKKSLIFGFYDNLGTFCCALSVMVFLLLFVFRLVTVDGRSMETTLFHNDKLIISDLFYSPKTGDIVVINPECNNNSGEPIIKRVIATEGQTVYIDYANWAVYVDGERLEEPYIQDMREYFKETFKDPYISMNPSNVPTYNEEFTVGENMVFVMGDNRNMSRDSRDSMYGEMNENRILGRVIIRITPNFGFVD